MATDHPLFIHRYMDRAALRGDSERFRIRVSAAFPTDERTQSAIRQSLRSEAGINPPSGQWGVLWERFFTAGALDEVLTAITIVVAVLRRQGIARYTEAFLSAIAGALADEHMGFRVDDHGVIHYAVDEAFEGTREATLVALNAPVLAVARGIYEASTRYLDHRPPDTKAAVRSMFEALEVVAKQLNPNARNLHENLCRNQLREQYLAVSGGDAVERRVWEGMFESMARCVNAMHDFRHGQVDNVASPTNDFAVYVLSSGSAFLRMLAQLALKVGVQPPPAPTAHAPAPALTPPNA